MPKPVFLKQPKQLALFRRGPVDDEDLRDEDEQPAYHSPLVRGSRQGAYTLACLPVSIHEYIRNSRLAMPPDLEESWGGVISYHRELASEGLIDFEWVDTREKVSSLGVRLRE